MYYPESEGRVQVDGPFSLRTVHFHLETHVCVTFVSLKRKNMES